MGFLQAKPKVKSKDLKLTVLPFIKKKVSPTSYDRIKKLLSGVISGGMSETALTDKMKAWKRDAAKLQLSTDDLQAIEDACRACMKI